MGRSEINPKDTFLQQCSGQRTRLKMSEETRNVQRNIEKPGEVLIKTGLTEKYKEQRDA